MLRYATVVEQLKITFDVIDAGLSFSNGDAYSISLSDIRNIAALDWINVKDFGAAGDGSDDTDAFQAAINEAIAKKGVVYVPCGRYQISDTLDMIGENSATATTGKGCLMIGETYAFGHSRLSK